MEFLFYGLNTSEEYVNFGRVVTQRCYITTVELLFAKAGLKLAIKWMEFRMSDNIRNKTIFETKIAKIAKKLPKSNILKKWSKRCKMGMSSLTLQKPPAILQCIVTEIWTRQNSNFKSGFFWPKLQNFCENLNFDFFVAKLHLVCYFGKKFENSTFKIPGDMARTREALQTDGRTDGDTRNQDLYMSPAGGDI